MFKKAILFSLSLLTFNLFLPEQKANATPAALTLGIIGTALGGTALGLGALNSYQLYRQRRNNNQAYYYDDSSYYAPTQSYYEDDSYYTPTSQGNYYYDDCNDSYGGYGY